MNARWRGGGDVGRLRGRRPQIGRIRELGRRFRRLCLQTAVSAQWARDRETALPPSQTALPPSRMEELHASVAEGGQVKCVAKLVATVRHV